MEEPSSPALGNQVCWWTSKYLSGYSHCKIHNAIYHQFLLSGCTVRKTTIRTKDPCYQDLIGKTNNLSFFDVKSVNLMYRLAHKCPNNDLLHHLCSVHSSHRCLPISTKHHLPFIPISSLFSAATCTASSKISWLAKTEVSLKTNLSRCLLRVMVFVSALDSKLDPSLF